MSQSYPCRAAPGLAAQLRAKSTELMAILEHHKTVQRGLLAALENVGVKCFLTDRSEVGADTDGLAIRKTMSLNDKVHKAIRWRQTICAAVMDEDWVKLNSNEFLPRKIENIQVLKPVEPDPIAYIGYVDGTLVEFKALCDQSATEMETLLSDRAALIIENAKLKEELMTIREHVKALEAEVSSTLFNSVAEHFLTDKSELGADTEGLAIRKTMSLNDKIPETMVPWGQTFCAAIVDEDWVKLKSNEFMPRRIDGFQVLKPVEPDPIASILYVHGSLVELKALCKQNSTEMETLQTDRASPDFENTKLKEELRSIRDHVRALEGKASSILFNAAAEHFLADKRHLGADTEGLAIRKTMSLNDRIPETMIPWGQTICAATMDDDWVRLKLHEFLPRRIDGVQVLKPVEPDPLASLNFVKCCLEMLQSDRDALATESTRLKEWPLNALYPWRLRETLQPAEWHFVDGAPATVLQASCMRDSPVWQGIVNMFRNRGRNPFHVRSITALHSEDGLKIFEGTLARLEQRRQEGGVFNAPMNDDDPHRLSTIDRLKQHFLKQPPSLKLANVIFVWHGGSNEAIAGIARNGFADLKRTDKGWFGSGLYSTTDSQYACMYSTGEVSSLRPVGPGPWKVVLAAMAMSNAFPVTRADYPEGQHSCKYQGKPLETGYYAHAAVVDPTDGYQAARNSIVSDLNPLEVVAAQEAQLLPVAVIEFQ